MASWRGRDSQKQVSCREANESAARALGEGPADRTGRFRCECGDQACSTSITLSLADYELVRRDAAHFVIARDHENPESERVVEENELFAIVEVLGHDELQLARRTDPRQRRREKRWNGSEKPRNAR